MRRLQGRLTATSCSSLPNYAAYLIDHPEEYQHLLRSFLISNAARYAAQSDRIDVRLKKSGDFAEITVPDYGPGIPADDLPQIFTRFFQSQRAGRNRSGNLGLGLFISHQIATAHGGDLTVQSVEGKGAAFTLRLPLTEPPR